MISFYCKAINCIVFIIPLHAESFFSLFFLQIVYKCCIAIKYYSILNGKPVTLSSDESFLSKHKVIHKIVAYPRYFCDDSES